MASSLSAAKPTVIPEVRLVYLVPSDRTLNSSYAVAIANAGRVLKQWYQGQLGNTRTFDLHTPAVDVVQSTHPVAWYQSNGGNGFAQFYYNAAQDVFAAIGGGYNDPNYVYAIYIDAESACGQCGGCGGSGVLVVGSNDLKGLVGQPSIRYCATDPAPVQYPPCRWVGGLGHELGHSFGLPHPPGCDQGLPTCDYNDIMWVGYAAYPATYLNTAELATLNQSPFFKAQSPFASGLASCNNLLLGSRPQQLAAPEVTPNPAHDLLTVRWPTPLTAPTTLVLADALGRPQRRYAITQGSAQSVLDVQGLPAGVYVLRYGHLSQKLLLQ
ncbi:T9SS type A sorting domain-containing protein [Hymenobacter jeollabukensis]|uniref:T9SS type A sorting domain-containing protein n=1 Tax=Hymenobacter jeollabukensis TaxID=2025313 RepID=UPI0014859EE2|nr:T9SS type A sorting domain-containing protein [Hymenobacter jeollabukensis]